MRSSAVILSVLLAACMDPEPFEGIPCVPGSSTEDDDVSFDPTETICVEITMDPGDYEALSAQYRFAGTEEDQWQGVVAATAPSCSEPYPDTYTYFPADVSIDGLEARDVGIRKKGFIGSVIGAGARPSLKIKTDEYVDDQTLGETERVTLNNNHSDSSRMRNCLVAGVFEDASYPSPQCNLANVSVNGVWLGTYAHVEAADERFLRRTFGNDEGSLYEGTIADFTDAHLAGLPDSLGRFEAKTDATDSTGAGLWRIAMALQVPDEELEASLAAVIDLDAFIRFWAIETLVDHSDGYNGNTNNYFVYFDPDRQGRAVFVPWGTDGSMWSHDSSFVISELARRMSRHPDLHARYLVELGRLLDEVWDEDRLYARIDAFSAQVATAETDLGPHQGSVDQLHGWVGESRGRIEAFIESGGSMGAEETGPCTGDFHMEDLLILGEFTTIASMSCSTAPPPASGFIRRHPASGIPWWIGILLAACGRRLPSASSRGCPGRRPLP